MPNIGILDLEDLPYVGHMMREARQYFRSQWVKSSTDELGALLNNLDPLLNLIQTSQRFINIIQRSWDLVHLLLHNLLDGSNEMDINGHHLTRLPGGLLGGILYWTMSYDIDVRTFADRGEWPLSRGLWGALHHSRRHWQNVLDKKSLFTVTQPNIILYVYSTIDMVSWSAMGHSWGELGHHLLAAPAVLCASKVHHTIQGYGFSQRPIFP